MSILVPWSHWCGFIVVFFCLFYAGLKAGGSSHAEGTIKGTDSVQSFGRRTGESLECSQMEKIRGDVSACQVPEAYIAKSVTQHKAYFVYCYANYVEGQADWNFHSASGMLNCWMVSLHNAISVISVSLSQWKIAEGFVRSQSNAKGNKNA